MGSRLRRTVLFAIWIGAIAGLFATAMRYERTAGESGAAPARWPADLPIARTPGHATILLAAHPHCPCSRATAALLRELHAVRSARGETTDLVVVMFTDAAQPDTWARTALWTELEALPRTRMVADPDGRLAARLGARTSGHVVAYDAAGTLRFSGGLTAARGTAIASPGFHAVRAMLAGQAPAVREAPVYGCSLISVTDTDVSRTRS